MGSQQGQHMRISFEALYIHTAAWSDPDHPRSVTLSALGVEPRHPYFSRFTQMTLMATQVKNY